MRASIWPLLAMLLISVATDAYIWVQSRRRCRSIEWSRLQLATSLLLWLFIIAMVALPARRGSNWQLLSKMWLLFVWVSVYFPKLFAVVADLLAAIPTLFHRRRLRRLTKAGIICAFAGSAIMWWGALINRYHIQVRQAEVPVVNLPESFDGMRIAHFSDLHIGTFGTDTAFVSLLVDSINGLQPDAIMFTGDIVNRRTDEIRPFVPVLRRLHAPMGVYAIMGNNYLKGNARYGIQENFGPDFRVLHFPEQLFTGYDIAEFEALFEDFPVRHLTTAAADGILELASGRRDFDLPDEEFEGWVRYHLATCEKRELLGQSSHLLYICRKD